jgi:hypothetical protein
MAKEEQPEARGTKSHTRDEKLDELLGRAIRDHDFRKRLTTVPAQVATEFGLPVEELQVFAAALAIGSKFGPGQVAFCTARICNEGSASQVKMPKIYWELPQQKK